MRNTLNLLVLVLGLALTATARADEGTVLIELKDGTAVEGRLLDFKQGVFRVKANGAERTIRERDVKRLTFLRPAPKLDVKVGPEQRLTIDVVDADVRQLILEIARKGEINLTVSPDVRGRVTMRITRQQPLQALKIVAETIGDYAVVYDAEQHHARVVSRSSLEQQLVLTAYRLVQRPANAETLKARTSLHRAVDELVLSSGINGATAQYDFASQTLFVQTTERGQEAVARILGDERRSPPADQEHRSEKTVSLELEDANVRAALDMASGKHNVPLIASPDVQGQVSCHYRDLPLEYIVQQLAKTTGDFVVVDSPVGMLVVARYRTELWLASEAIPVVVPPKDFWRAGGYLLSDEIGVWPPHPMPRAFEEILLALGMIGTCAKFDAGSHHLLVTLPVAFRSQLVGAFVKAGYFAPPLAQPTSESIALGKDRNIREVLSEIAKERSVDIVISPDVRGTISGSYRKAARTGELIAGLARAVGDYAVVQRPAGTYRVVTRSSIEQQLETARIPLRTRPSAAVEENSLAWALNEIVLSTGINGAIAQYEPEGNFFVVSLPAPYLDQIKAIVKAADTRATIDALQGELLFSASGGRSFLVHQVQPSGSVRSQAALLPDTTWRQHESLEYQAGDSLGEVRLRVKTAEAVQERTVVGHPGGPTNDELSEITSRDRQSLADAKAPDANEAGAIASLKLLGTSQALFRDGDKDGDGSLVYAGSLEALAKVGLIDQVLASGTQHGYRFELCRSAISPEFHWMAVASPVETGVTGDRHFVINHEGVVYSSTEKPFTLDNRTVCEIPEGATPVGK